VESAARLLQACFFLVEDDAMHMMYLLCEGGWVGAIAHTCRGIFWGIMGGQGTAMPRVGISQSEFLLVTPGEHVRDAALEGGCRGGGGGAYAD